MFSSLIIVGDWIAWTNDTSVFLMSLDGALFYELETYMGYVNDTYEYPYDLHLDGDWLVWTVFSSPDGDNHYAYGYAHHIPTETTIPIVSKSRSETGQTGLTVDQDRFVWQDSRGATHDLWWREVANQPPTAIIDSISPNPAEQGTTVFFYGNGDDADGTIAAYEWTSNLVGGTLSTAQSFSSSSLPLGTHSISLRVQDNEGEWSEAVTETLSITAATSNEAPTAYISSISPNPAKPGQMVNFIGGGNDPDGSIVFYSWWSSRDGEISFEAEFSTDSLSEGTHYISFTVADDDNAYSDAVDATLVVGNATGPVKHIDFSHPEEDGEKVEGDTPVYVYLTMEGEEKLYYSHPHRIRLLLESPALDTKTLFDTAKNGSDEIHGESIFAVNISAMDLEMLKSYLKDYGSASYFFPLEGTLFTDELPNGRYTLRTEILDSEGEVIMSAERTIVVENPRIEPAPAVAGAAVGVVAGGAAGAALGGAGAAAGGAAGGAGGGGVQADGVGSKLRRKKKLTGGLFGEGFAILLALIGMVLAYAYASLAQPTLDPLSNLGQFNTVLLSDIGGFLADLGHMVLFLGMVMAIVIIFRAGVDHLAAQAQGVKSVFKLQAPGTAALGLSTALFGMPFGYPAQSVHEKKAGNELREARIAMSQIMGTLVLVLPFWIIWQFVEVARFMAEIGLTVVLMTAFSIAIPLKHSEGRSIYRWSRELSLVMMVILVFFFYGWQLDFLPTALLPLLGLAGIAAMPNLLKPAPRGPSPYDDLEDEGPGDLPEAPRGWEKEPEGDEAFRPPDKPRTGWGDTEPGAPGEAPPGDGWGEPPSPDTADVDGPPSEPLPEAPPLPDEPLPAPAPVEPPLGPPEVEPEVKPDVERPPEAEPEIEPEVEPEPDEEPEEPREREAAACISCGKAIDTNWKICPYCSTKQ